MRSWTKRDWLLGALCGVIGVTGYNVPAAMGNAVFDATGVRLRKVPFTPERVKRALERA